MRLSFPHPLLILVLYPTGPFSEALWSMFMLPDDIAIGFFWTEAVSTASLPNVFPETAQNADYVCLFPFSIAKSR